MRFLATAIPDVILVEPQVFQDERGFFLESYQARKFAAGGIAATFVQDNHSGSRRGTLRGLHFQTQHPQGKLVRVIAGEVFDVAVDIRRGSPTFGKWVGVSLTAENKQQLWVPPGLAHGFFVVSDWAELVYKVTDFYAPEDERTLLWSDPQLAINWPLKPGETPVLSRKDMAGKLLRELVEV